MSSLQLQQETPQTIETTTAVETFEEIEMDQATLYLTSISLKEFKAYEIAKSHLGTSFDLERSNGFLEWKKKHYGK
jgi:hypothetical protein